MGSSQDVPGQLLVFDPRDPNPGAVREYKVRKSHKKSRAGCIKCKTRRVKCDEALPSCGPCIRRHIDCSYASTKGSASSSQVKPKTDELHSWTRPFFEANSMQNHFNRKFLYMWPSSLWPGRPTLNVLAQDPTAFTSRYDLPILHHLTDGTIGPSLFAERAPHFHIDVISIGCSNRHVMHALLAASALHIRFTRHPNLIATTAIDPAPSTLISCLTTPSSTDPFASVEAGHHLSASRLFRIALETFYTPTPYNDADMTSTSTTPTPFSTPQTPQIDIDPLLTTCMLLNMLSFAGLPEAGPPQSRWPFTQIPTPTTPPHARPLNWLRIQLGFSPILSNLTMHMKQTSQWLAFFMTLGHEVFYDDRTGTASIPASFCEFFGINEHSTIENHKYLRLVRRLVAILAVWQRTEAEGGGGARHDEQVLRYLQFMQGVDEVFLTRLEGRTDVRCLVTYGWFMAVLSYVRHWWCRVRAVRECQGVVEWLDGWCAGEWRLEGGRWEMTGNQTGFWADEEEEEERKRVKPWLPYMARAVGYELRRWDGGRQEEIQVGDGF